MSACFLFSLQFPDLPVVMLLLGVCFPFFLSRYMKRMVDQEPAYARFSPLWLCGIYTVIFGTLICSLFTAVYVTVINPSFMSDYFNSVIATLESATVPENYSGMADVLRRAKEQHILPGGMQFVATMGWFTCFGGSILSLVIALIISGSRRRATESMWR